MERRGSWSDRLLGLPFGGERAATSSSPVAPANGVDAAGARAAPGRAISPVTSSGRPGTAGAGRRPGGRCPAPARARRLPGAGSAHPTRKGGQPRCACGCAGNGHPVPERPHQQGRRASERARCRRRDARPSSRRSSRQRLAARPSRRSEGRRCPGGSANEVTTLSTVARTARRALREIESSLHRQAVEHAVARHRVAVHRDVQPRAAGGGQQCVAAICSTAAGSRRRHRPETARPRRRGRAARRRGPSRSPRRPRAAAGRRRTTAARAAGTPFGATA